MWLTVLGANGAVPRPGGACSGYLVQDGGTTILIDCGTGVYARLQQHVDPFALSAIFISHLHPDHFFDLVPFRYALRYALHGGPPEPPQLWVPLGGIASLERFAGSFVARQDFFGEVFAIREYDPADAVQVGGMLVTFQETRHYVPSFGIRVSGSGQFAYSADTTMCEEAVAVATGADLFLCEATAQESTLEQVKGGHLSAVQAGEIATRAAVPRLLLTHIWHELDPLISLAEASRAYSGPVEIATEGALYEVRSSDGR